MNLIIYSLPPYTNTTFLYSIPSSQHSASCHPLFFSPSPFPALLRDLDQGRREGKQTVHDGVQSNHFYHRRTGRSPLVRGIGSEEESTRSGASVTPPTPAPAPAPQYVDLAELLSVAGPFHTFLNYLEKTNVIETFQSQANKTDEGITIFVPKDSAFAAIKKSTFSNLTGDQLKTLLLYHAFPKFYSLAEFKNLSALNPVNTFAGSPYTLNLTDDMGSIYVQSMWSKPKISSSVYTTNPVAVYALNKVLLPMQIFSKDPPLAPAPAPAPESGASDLAPGPASGKAGGGSGKADSTSAAYSVGVSAVNYLVLAAAGGLMLLW